jgi:hypothetical protein
MATVKQALEDIEKAIREALEVPDTAKIRRLKINDGEFEGEITADGQNWFGFKVGKDEAEIFEA